MSFLGEETLCKVTSILQCVAHLSPALRVPFIWAHGNPRAELLSQAYQTEICSSLSMSCYDGQLEALIHEILPLKIPVLSLSPKGYQ